MTRKPAAPVEIHCTNCDYRGSANRPAGNRRILCPNCIRPITRKDGRQGRFLKAADFLHKIPAVRHNIADLKADGPVALRLIQTQTHIRTSQELATVWSHAVFCQIGLPYRDPGDNMREWERRNGNLFLKVNAGEASIRTRRNG